jgi:hypothetical protein
MYRTREEANTHALQLQAKAGAPDNAKIIVHDPRRAGAGRDKAARAVRDTLRAMRAERERATMRATRFHTRAMIKLSVSRSHRRATE